jgi:uncharacterized protein YyaL (SSP411 family)
VQHDPHGEFNGKNILYQAHTLEETAAHFTQPLDIVRRAMSEAERVLFETRSRRPRPHRDDKILTAWNGLMISAFAQGGAVLDEPVYAQAARRAAQFILARMYDPQTGILLRRYREGDARIPGFLDDYAFFAQALLDLYEAQFDRRHLELAIRLTDKQRDLFEDPENGAFFSSPAGDSSLVLRVKDDYDGAEPSGNSVALANLLRLLQFTGRADFQLSADKLLAAFSSRLSVAQMAIPQLLAACEFRLNEPRQIVIVGDPNAPATRALLRIVHGRFLPNRVLILLDSDQTRDALAAGAPAVASMHPLDGLPAAYVCRNYACQLPVAEPAQLAELLQ